MKVNCLLKSRNANCNILEEIFSIVDDLLILISLRN